MPQRLLLLQWPTDVRLAASFVGKHRLAAAAATSAMAVVTVADGCQVQTSKGGPANPPLACSSDGLWRDLVTAFVVPWPGPSVHFAAGHVRALF